MQPIRSILASECAAHAREPVDSFVQQLGLWETDGAWRARCTPVYLPDDLTRAATAAAASRSNQWRAKGGLDERAKICDK